jgi:hypothetical protein
VQDIRTVYTVDDIARALLQPSSEVQRLALRQIPEYLQRMHGIDLQATQRSHTVDRYLTCESVSNALLAFVEVGRPIWYEKTAALVALRELGRSTPRILRMVARLADDADASVRLGMWCRESCPFCVVFSHTSEQKPSML